MPILILVLAVVAVDQLSKFYVQSKMTLGLSLPVVDNIFHITYILNPGAAFGILEHQTVFFIAIAVLMLAAVLYVYPRLPQGSPVLRLGIGLMAGGAAGNVIDRIRTGYVVDFLDFRVWPVFNIADMAIVGGVGLIIFALYYLPEKKDGCND
ncbi:signal peptidase II|uniref:Lipoprotein signal peptidase n=1 Tax=Dendrosporobacter quercicolus TaxID=146817 RepID=A0A1G9M698_9FIRM|nr:signal peptidase II [Dendrosporobacter quercicolus]NSL46924.1 signal peptidase II [Dendrosporobacter quercicolus DSM 1736]SDL69487.1 signal peptidase II [Dendrosporobacter quercicolus]